MESNVIGMPRWFFPDLIDALRTLLHEIWKIKYYVHLKATMESTRLLELHGNKIRFVSDFFSAQTKWKKQSPLHLIDFKVSLFNLNYIYVLVYSDSDFITWACLSTQAFRIELRRRLIWNSADTIHVRFSRSAV